MTKTYGLVAIIVLTVVAIILVGVISVRAQILDRTDNTDPVIVEKAVPLTDAIHHHVLPVMTEMLQLQIPILQLQSTE